VATILSHGIAAAAIGTAFPPPKSARFWFYGIVLSMTPDADVIGFRFGVHYGDLLGHRGLSHSIAFAIVLNGIATAAIYGQERLMKWRILWLYLFLATISHGILDAFTNGGLGVAFFAPFSNTRYFFPWNPIEVSPIGSGFFSSTGVEVLSNEAIWIWMPCLFFVFLMWLLRKRKFHCFR
jgi:inner membrane protein